MTDAAPPRPASLSDLGREMAADLAQLDIEIAEVDLLGAGEDRGRAPRATAGGRVRQACGHVRRRGAASAGTAPSTDAPWDKEAPPATDLNAQLVLLTKRAALMESQVDVLEGKRRALARSRDALLGYEAAVTSLGDVAVPLPGPSGNSGASGRATAAARQSEPSGPPPAVSRLLLGAQEDLRREIAGAMHDGPAQSPTITCSRPRSSSTSWNATPPARATRSASWWRWSSRPLEATKSFIFGVRPMVLDDLGLVLTLRRAARERGRRAGVAVGFDLLGVDRRLPMDLESGLFRMIDEAMAAYLSVRADHVSVRLDWSDQVDVRVSATRAVAATATDATPDATGDVDLPPALAAMMEDRRAAARDAAAAARREAIVVLAPSTWREVSGRAATLGIAADLSDDGSEVHLVLHAPLPGNEPPTGDAEAPAP